MDVLDEELLSLWEMLDKNQVRYIMIGGFATNLHGYQRHTGDIDLWIEDTLENRKRLRLSFKELGLGDFEPLERVPFIAGWTDFQLNSGFKMDIMSSVKGLENIPFSVCYDLASIAEIEHVKVRFLHLNHLIASKLASNRPKDQLDIIELNKIKEFREKDT